ncbi:MAG TPA: hypothetical protein V6C88_13720 [Chroococcidiopsis sp.]
MVDRFLAGFTPIVAVILLGVAVDQLLPTPLWDWHASRLASTFALTHGYELYYGPDQGPIFSTHKGPLAYWAYLPATLAQSPTAAIVLGECVALACFFLPILYLLLAGSFKTQQQRVMALSAFFCFSFLAFTSEPLRLSASAVHADAPALGLGAIACIILYFRKDRSSMLALITSALFVVLSVWTKQIAFPLLVGLPLYVWLTEGFKPALRYVASLVVAGLVVSGLFLLIFDAQALIFNTVAIAKNHSWQQASGLKEQAKVLMLGAQKLLQSGFVYCIALAFYGLYQQATRQGKPTSLRQWLRENRWTVFLVAGLVTVPTSILGYIKVGGYYNNFSFTIYFLLTATILVLLETASDLSPNALAPAGRLLVPVLLVAFVCVETPLLYNLPWKISTAAKNDQQLAYNYDRQHPGEVYFPWNPLSTLLGEGRLYHFEFSVIDRNLAGFTVTPEHFRAHIPSAAQFIAFSSYSQESLGNLGAIQTTLDYLPEFSVKTEIKELPGFLVYAKPQ